MIVGDRLLAKVNEYNEAEIIDRATGEIILTCNKEYVVKSYDLMEKLVPYVDEIISNDNKMLRNPFYIEKDLLILPARKEEYNLNDW